MVLRLPENAVKTSAAPPVQTSFVEAPLVSRLHCKLTSAASDQLVVEDLGSTNGNLVNGKRVDRSG